MHYFCHFILSPKFLLTLFKPLAFICNMSSCTIRLFWWLCMLHDNDTSDFLMCFLFCGMCLILRCYYNAFYFLSQGNRSFFFRQFNLFSPATSSAIMWTCLTRTFIWNASISFFYIYIFCISFHIFLLTSLFQVFT